VAATAELQRRREEEERMVGTALLFLRASVKLEKMLDQADGDVENIPFAEIDSLVEKELFELKEECHWLFRSEERSGTVKSRSAMLFDILVGSLFHQCMKVKENSYQVEQYEPKYAALRESLERPDAPKHVRAFLREGERIVKRARRVLRQEFTHAQRLFREAAVALRYVLVEHRDCTLLARTLVDNEALLDAVYGPRALDKLFREMYGGTAAGLVMAATSFFEGGWYERARELCKRARKLEPGNEAAAQLLNKINAAANAHLR